MHLPKQRFQRQSLPTVERNYFSYHFCGKRNFGIFKPKLFAKAFNDDVWDEWRWTKITFGVNQCGALDSKLRHFYGNGILEFANPNFWQRPATTIDDGKSWYMGGLKEWEIFSEKFLSYWIPFFFRMRFYEFKWPRNFCREEIWKVEWVSSSVICKHCSRYLSNCISWIQTSTKIAKDTHPPEIPFLDQLLRKHHKKNGIQYEKKFSEEFFFVPIDSTFIMRHHDRCRSKLFQNSFATKVTWFWCWTHCNVWPIRMKLILPKKDWCHCGRSCISMKICVALKAIQDVKIIDSLKMYCFS